MQPIPAQASPTSFSAASSCAGIAWQHIRMAHATNPSTGIADVLLRGELLPHLEREREGWARSQRSDIERLQAEIQDECGSIFAALEARLKDMAPEALFVKPWVSQLTEMVEAEKVRLKVLEAEVIKAYESEIDAAMWQCEEDYRGYDGELQRVLFRSFEARFQRAREMRELKLALCRWRLDYQAALHQHSERLSKDVDRRHSNHSLLQAREAGPARFAMMRRLVRRLWQHSKVPVPEIHEFLGRVTDLLSKRKEDAEVAKIRSFYREELKKHGAVPLLQHAQRPELLETSPTFRRSARRMRRWQ